MEVSKPGTETAVIEDNVPEKKKEAKLQDTGDQEVSNEEDAEDGSSFPADEVDD